MELTMDETNIIVEAANKRTKLMYPDADSKPGKGSGKKMSIEDFLMQEGS